MQSKQLSLITVAFDKLAKQLEKAQMADIESVNVRVIRGQQGSIAIARAKLTMRISTEVTEQELGMMPAKQF